MLSIPRLTVALRECPGPSGLLAAQLGALSGQTLGARLFEVVVAGDAAGIPDDLPFAVRCIPHAGAPGAIRALNLAVQAARGETVLLLRPDAVPEPDCLRLHLETHDAMPDADYCVLGRLDAAQDAAGSAWGRLAAGSDLLLAHSGLENGAICGWERFDIGHLSVPRSMLLAAGVFDEAFGDDVLNAGRDLGIRLARIPVPVVYRGQCAARLPALPGVDELCRQAAASGEGLFRLLARSPEAREALGGMGPADEQFWAAPPDRLRLRLEALAARLKLLEDARPAMEPRPLPPPARERFPALAAACRRLPALRTRDALALLEPLEQGLDKLLAGLRSGTAGMQAAALAAYPAALLLRRCHEALGAARAAGGSRQPAASQPPADLAASRGRVLLCCNFFWPSVGGTELIVEEIGARLAQAGYAVDVACRHLDERAALVRRGMRIHPFRCRNRFFDGDMGPDLEAYRRFVAGGDYKAVIALAHPDSWVCWGLRGLPAGAPPVAMMASMNARNLDDWQGRGVLEEVGAVLRSASAHITVSEGGVDAAVLGGLGLPSTFLPHAVTDEAAPWDMRGRLSLQSDTPLLACVGNFWPVKNQLELLRVMTAAPGDWRLALAGAVPPWPAERDYYLECRRLAAGDPRIHFAGPLPPLEAAALIRDADALLLPSQGESAGPLVVLQAMALGTPWIATPECNAVKDEAGGLVTPLGEFPQAVAALLERPQAAARLAALGREHWERCFTWERSLCGFIGIIERLGGNGQARGGRGPVQDLRMPADLRARWQDAARALLPG